MHWEFMYGNREAYNAKVRESQREQFAHRVWMANHPWPRFAKRQKTRLGQWLVAWGLALQAQPKSSFDAMTAAQPKWYSANHCTLCSRHPFQPVQTNKTRRMPY